ncbi:MAG: response regulator CheY-like protein [Gemmatimonadetes bacterium]|nr:response regulator CheY-like protein [Gemmatimonadota bacterium]
MDSETIKSASIVIVDDEEMNLRILRRFLESEGYTGVFTTTDGREVISHLQTRGADLVVMDLYMPFPDGFVLLDWIGAAIGKDEYLPILVVTADFSIETRNRALALGARDFLTKPFDFFEARYRIRNLLQARDLYRQLKACRDGLGTQASGEGRGPADGSGDAGSGGGAGG